MRNLLRLGVVLCIGVGVSALAAVGTGYTLFGSATYVSPGHNSNRAVKLVADLTTEFSGVDYAVPPGLTINDLNSLSTDTNFPTGSTCGGGSPRFAIQLSGLTGNIHVYIGPPPSYTGCPSNVWTNTGNLLTPASLVDTSQLPGGTFYDPWAAAQARYSGRTVTGIQSVTDTFAGPRTVIIDNTEIEGTVYDYEFNNKNDCKNSGWQNFTSAPGPFRNQGQCVSYFARQK